MRKALSLTVALLIGLSAATGAFAANTTQCRDAKGKFIKCPPPAAHCRDVKTKKFAKCGLAGTEPVPVKH